MADAVVFEKVILRGEDLNWTHSPWRSVTRANNMRLLPIFFGMAGLTVAIGLISEPTFTEYLALVAPLLIGWGAFIWLTNVHFMGAYKKGYAASPVGAGPTSFEFSDFGMRQHLERGECSYQWSAFVEVIEDQNGTFRFWMTPFTAVVLPARYVTTDKAAALRDLVAAARARGDIKGVPDE